jgi:hypothetical protein
MNHIEAASPSRANVHGDALHFRSIKGKLAFVLLINFLKALRDKGMGNGALVEGW